MEVARLGDYKCEYQMKANLAKGLIIGFAKRMRLVAGGGYKQLFTCGETCLHRVTRNWNGAKHSSFGHFLPFLRCYSQ